MQAVLALRRGCPIMCSLHLSHKRPSLNHQLQTPRQLRRNVHQSVSTGEVLLKGCEKLPDLTFMWPFHLWPSDVAATLFNHLQVYSDMPWWSTIIAGGVIIKVPLIFFNIYNLRRIQRFFVTSPRQVTHFVLTYFNNLVTKGEVHALKMANDERRFTIYREGLCVDLRYRMQGNMFGHITYIPLYWIAGMHASTICGLHWMNRIQYIPLTVGGLPWCLDLTLPDPYMILPTLCIASGLLNLYLHPMHWLFPLPEFKLNHIIPLAPLFAVGFSLLSSLPADIVLYMISANLTACVLNTGLRSPRVYSEFGLLSLEETINRTIPPATLFHELTKSLDRQSLLLEQKREQEALKKPESLTMIEGEKSIKLIKKGSEPADEEGESKSKWKESTKLELPAINAGFVKKKCLGSQSADGDLAPHLNVKKVF